MNVFKKRLPARNEINLVMGVVIFAVHTWSIRNFLYKIPSFLLYTTPMDTFAIFCYMMAFALLESFAVTVGLLFLAAVLPLNWLREGFAYKGFVMVFVFTAASIWLQGNVQNQFPPKSLLYTLILIVFLGILILSWLIHKIPQLQKIVIDIEDRIGIMQYVYIPLGLLGLVIVVIRIIL